MDMIGICVMLPFFPRMRPARSYIVARSVLWRITPPQASTKLLVSSTVRSYTNSSVGSTCSFSTTSAANESASPTDLDRIKVERYSRSEEHTSELQSRGHLVCRLLLEK